MGVETGHRDAGSGQAEVPDQRGMGDADGVFQEVLGQGGGHL
jgi:hypothetical protein